MGTVHLPLMQVAIVSHLLFKERDYHSDMAQFYFSAFNGYETGETPETVAAIGYPPLKAFYQEQAQYHQTRVLRAEAKISQYRGIVDRNSPAL